MRWLRGATTCRSVESLLWDYDADGQETAGFREVRLHLACCSACRKKVQDYQAVRRSIQQAATTSVPDSERGWAEVAARIQAQNPETVNTLRTIRATFFGAALAAALWLLFIHRPAAPEEAQMQYQNQAASPPVAHTEILPPAPVAAAPPAARSSRNRPRRPAASVVLSPPNRSPRRRTTILATSIPRRETHRLESRATAMHVELAALDGMKAPDSPDTQRARYVAPDNLPATGEVEASYVLEGAPGEEPVVEARGW